MGVFLVFNELSATPMAPSMAEAERLLKDFSELLVDQRIKGRRVFVAPGGFLQLQVHNGYSVGRWLAQGRLANQDVRLRVKTLIDRRSEYRECVPPEELAAQDVEYKCAGQPAQGLFVTLSVDGLAISMRSGDQWSAAEVKLEKSWPCEWRRVVGRKRFIVRKPRFLWLRKGAADTSGRE
jgi:hypothetical protein